MKRPIVTLVSALAACSREPSFQDLQSAVEQELQRDLEAARAHAEAGRRRAASRRDPVWDRRFRVLNAEVLVEQRRYADALALLYAEGPLEAPLDLIQVRVLMTRGRARCHSADGEEAFGRAEDDLEEARHLAAKLESSRLLGEVTRHRGTCALLRGDYQTAETYFREVLATARREKWPSLEARAAGSLGLVRMRTDRYDDAADWFQRALDLAAAAKADLVVVTTLLNLGWCYYRLGDYDRALAYLSKAESLAKAGGNTGDRLLILQNIGNAHYRLGDLERAGEDYRRALAIARDQGDQKRTAELVSNLGTVALEQGRYDDAETSVREALRIKTEIGDLPAKQNSLLAQGRISAERGEHARAEALYREVVSSPHSSKEILWATRAALASLLIKTSRPTEAELEFARAFGIMEESRAELRQAEHKISFLSSLGQFYDSYVDFLVEAGRVPQALAAADQGRARQLREGLGNASELPSVDSERFKDVARALDAVVLFYWMAPHRSFLWVVTPRKVEVHTLPGETQIAKQVEAQQRHILQSRDPLGEGAPEAEWLYRNLVGLAEASIPRGARVLFVPDGPLHQINPETLVVPSPERHYWLEDVTLATAPSLALLAAPRSKRLPGPAPNILIIGDPVTATTEFQSLPHAAKEIQRIGEQFSPHERTIYSGARADPTVYKAADPGRFAFIHFAAHAKANSEIPLDSAVILSASNESYKLYAREILSVPLKAELVSLSACRSAGSRTYAGEGLVGLAWAFLSAGAANVVAGLWNVEDASTAALMEGLYRGLNRGLGPADALRGAKLSLLRSGTAYRKPFYWAPFMIYTATGCGTSPRLIPGPQTTHPHRP